MPSDVLNRTELEEVTGYVKRSKQIEWLRTQRPPWPFAIGGDGYARVLRSVRDERMGAPVRQASPQPKLSHLRVVQ